MGIKENFLKIKSEIPDVRVVAVTKYVDSKKIIEAYEAGIRDFGESKIQDFDKKKKELPQEINKNITWHFIGHIQTNKAKKITGNFDYIHSVDSLKIAELLSKTATEKKLKQKIFLQINYSEEETKYGFRLNELKENFEKIMNLNSIKISGLMTIAPFTKEEKVQREVFKGLRELRNELQSDYKINIPDLSMGMSNDYKTAYEEGSTIVRIGQAIFKEN